MGRLPESWMAPKLPTSRSYSESSPWSVSDASAKPGVFAPAAAQTTSEVAQIEGRPLLAIRREARALLAGENEGLRCLRVAAAT